MTIKQQITDQLEEFLDEIKAKAAHDPNDIMLTPDVIEDVLNGGFQYYADHGHVEAYHIDWDDDSHISITYTTSDEPLRTTSTTLRFRHLEGDGSASDLTSGTDDAYDRAMRGI